VTVLQAMDRLGMTDILGEIDSDIQLVELIEQGLPPDTADKLREFADLTTTEFGEIIPHRSLSRARSRGRLSPEQSDRIIRAARIYAIAHEVCGNREKANRWVRRPNRALAGRAPISLLRTNIGADLVEDVLTRIAYGVYS
jgi:putative toxin-antitoxin system antitoxin component (TIGR02293 family)